MGKFSQKMMGKEVGSASVYAEPHTMGGVSLKGFGKEANSAKQSAAGSRIGDPNKQNALETSPTSGSKRVSAGDPGRDDVKTLGIKIRGTGCATKGVMARGPMG